MPKDRFIIGDRYFLPQIRNFIKGKKISGVERVFLNLCKGFDSIGIPYKKNLPFSDLQPADKVIVLGAGRDCLLGYDKPNPIIAGIALMTHPSEWPDLFQQYPVKVYLQHSLWAKKVYEKYYGVRCDIWPVGIDVKKWRPIPFYRKDIDVLIYDKIRWDHEEYEKLLLNPVYNAIRKQNLNYTTIKYGFYEEEAYFQLLKRSRSMIFLCEHESQGIAYQQALSMDVPIFAWDQGKCLDPNRFAWGDNDIDATSVPYFDDRCGMKFTNTEELEINFQAFWEGAANNRFKPREYILEYLTLEKSANQMLRIVEKWSNS